MLFVVRRERSSARDASAGAGVSQTTAVLSEAAALGPRLPPKGTETRMNSGVSTTRSCRFSGTGAISSSLQIARASSVSSAICCSMPAVLRARFSPSSTSSTSLISR